MRFCTSSNSLPECTAPKLSNIIICVLSRSCYFLMLLLLGLPPPGPFTLLIRAICSRQSSDNSEIDSAKCHFFRQALFSHNNINWPRRLNQTRHPGDLKKTKIHHFYGHSLTFSALFWCKINAKRFINTKISTVRVTIKQCLDSDIFSNLTFLN